MSERKGINKYYPPDWDPSKIPKKKKTGNEIIKVRLMTPFSMRCGKCNEYIGERRKFNARKEVTGEKYMNVKIIRFYLSCPRCTNTINLKTNPQTAGYIIESGAVKNFEPTATNDVPVQETEEQILERLEREEKENKEYQTLKKKRKQNPFWQKDRSLKDDQGDVLENLEKKMIEQQRQQEITSQIENLQKKYTDISAKGGSDALLDAAQKRLQEEAAAHQELSAKSIEKQDEEEAAKAFSNRRHPNIGPSSSPKDEGNTDEKVPESKDFLTDSLTVPKITVKKRKVTESSNNKLPINELTSKKQTNTITSLFNYSSDDD
ncbi:Piso0_001091 [Millerozyma farinosa CBS 7064]|uniref:Splicing factor YJU2 n=1 Tax=Pichia sorbitophila (strain ATCC MYA-4447 / BCRC 22081 / CBS 7064 / NBRC 10061 / NRRL Y-12695) TaxID=559304 RepID=G8YSD1_PICSO|nr:Piso0_001091 [Millerozyma farinosa CBS 7064]CCE79054.1 Piso0_001091 [Millerozyma farinosa CBS 7064]